jgi:hypothetical protein
MNPSDKTFFSQRVSQQNRTRLRGRMRASRHQICPLDFVSRLSVPGRNRATQSLSVFDERRRSVFCRERAPVLCQSLVIPSVKTGFLPRFCGRDIHRSFPGITDGYNGPMSRGGLNVLGYVLRRVVPVTGEVQL